MGLRLIKRHIITVTTLNLCSIIEDDSSAMNDLCLLNVQRRVYIYCALLVALSSSSR